MASLYERMNKGEPWTREDVYWLELHIKWYGEKAEALKRYGTEKPPNATAMSAVVTELMLDGGRRARHGT